jgi:hypothetical protein
VGSATAGVMDGLEHLLHAAALLLGARPGH